MHISIGSIISDCRDANARARQEVRFASLFNGFRPSYIGVASDIEVAVNLTDVLDASLGAPGVVIVNVAPRSGPKDRWENGTPFGYTWYGECLVVATFGEFTLGVLKKFDLLRSFMLTDTATVVRAAVQHGLLSVSLSQYITVTQFRSYEYAPRLAQWICDGYDLPAQPLALEDIPDLPLGQVSWVDCFGNLKLTSFPEEAHFEVGATLLTRVGSVQCYRRFSDVPVGETGLVTGSSGLGDRRFLELVVQQGSAAERFGLKAGDAVL